MPTGMRKDELAQQGKNQMFGKNNPAPPDYTGAAERTTQSRTDATNAQTQANRPNQTNAFGATSQWTQGPDGQWTQSQQFGGPFAGAASALQGQAAANMATPFDFGQFGTLGNGDDARNQAINGAYSQATSRLDPQWQQRESQQRTQLLNQGLTEGSEAYQNAMGNLGRDRNDAYSSAMNGAIAQGTAAGHTAFGDNMAANQYQIGNALAQRGMPMADLKGLQAFLGQSGFNTAGSAGGVDYSGAAQDQFNADTAYNDANGQRTTDTIQGGAQFVSSILPFLFSDVRLKMNVTRHAFEVLPGVHAATWSYVGDPRVFLGVIAQDLEAVAPRYVYTRPDGLKMVDYSFLMENSDGH